MKLKKAIAAAVLVCASVLAAGGCGRRQAEPVSRSDFLLNTFVTVTLYDSEDEAILDGWSSAAIMRTSSAARRRTARSSA